MVSRYNVKYNIYRMKNIKYVERENVRGMKKIVNLFLVLMLSISTVACTNTEEEKLHDKDFIISLSKGLETRWKLNDEYDELINKGEIKETDEKKVIEYYDKFAKAELNEVEKYKDLKFEDSKLQEAAISYINLLKTQEEGVEEMRVDIDKGIRKWDEGYQQRSKLLTNFVKDYNLTVSDKYKTQLSDFEKVSNQVKDDEKIEDEVKKAEFKITNSSGGWKDYESIIKNDTDTNYEYFSIKINLLDKDEVILESTTAYVENWQSGQKAKFKFSTDCDFHSMSMECEY